MKMIPGSNLQLKQTILSYGANFLKNISGRKQNNHHHCILPIRISYCTKLTVLTFLDQICSKRLAQKGYL